MIVNVPSKADWPAPEMEDGWVFVTENPSVVTAAADASAEARLVCTAGTPSAQEIDALARLARAGWNLAVRADFDVAGIRHVAAMLAGIPGSCAWRMGAADYLDNLAKTPVDERVALAKGVLPGTPWNRALRDAMAEHGCAAYEESMIDLLLGDLRRRMPSLEPIEGKRTGPVDRS